MRTPVFRSEWADLATTTDHRFDAVLFIGNSRVHASGVGPMVEALRGFHNVLHPGGALVVDSRNWEKLHAEHRVVQVADHAVARGERRCTVIYVWEIPEAFDEDHVAHLVFVFGSGEVLEPHEHEIRFRPFTVQELCRRLQLAEFREVDTDFDEATDRYSFVAFA